MIDPTLPGPRPSLRELSLKHGSDKEGAHSYTRNYESLLAPLREVPLRVLEIGVGGYRDPLSGGNSLRMWKEYFPRAQIIGLDISEKKGLEEDRIRFFCGSQTDPKAIDELFAACGNFDVVIDDGSHMSADVTRTFGLVFPRLADGAIYFVEDTQTSYWNFCGGSINHNSHRTTMGFFKARVDGVNYAEFDRPWYRPSEFDRTIRALHFFHNLVAVEKGPNVQPSWMLPKHPHGVRRFLLRRPSLRFLLAPVLPLLRRVVHRADSPK